MPSFSNWLIAASYVVLTTALGIVCFRIFGFDPQAAIAAGVLSFLLCAQAHSVFNRTQERSAFEDELTFLQNGKVALSEEIENLRIQADEMTDLFNEKSDRRNHQVVSEVRLLETLVRQMAVEMENKARQTAKQEVAQAQENVSSGRDPRAVSHLIGAIEKSLLDAEARGDMTPGDKADLFDTMNETQLLEVIRTSLDENRVELYLQPVVNLPQRKVCFYEALSRLRSENGELILPAQYMRVAEPAGLMAIIDNLLLFRCVQLVRRLAAHDTEVVIMCNISMNTLQDKTFFPHFLDFMTYNSDLSDTLVFEFAKETIEQCGPVEAENLAKLASLDFKFSLDRVGDLDLDLPDLRQRNFRYLKVSSSLFLRGARPGNDAAVNPADLRQLLGRFGIDLIIERVENEGQVLEALEFDVSFAQGYLFGRPRPLEEVEASIGALAAREEEDRQQWQPLEYHPSSDQAPQDKISQDQVRPDQASGF